jgi:predicted N-formylglutamate amidohydrolase
LPYVEIEIRQDLVAAAEGQLQWAQRLTQALRKSAEVLFHL